MPYRRGDPVIFEDGPAVIFDVTDGGYVVHKLAKDGTTEGSPGNWDHVATEGQLVAARWTQLPKSRRPVDPEEEARVSKELLEASPAPVPGDTD